MHVSQLACAMPRLARLTLEKTDVTDEALSSLAILAPSLTYLDVSRTAIRGSEASYAALRGMRALTELLLAYCQVDLMLVYNLPPNLERLKCSRALQFDDAAIGCLAHELTAAHADGTPRPRGLKALDVGSPHITDAAISDLCALAHAGLDTLTLWHTKVSRVALERLMHATGLALDTSMGTSDGTYLLRR